MGHLPGLDGLRGVAIGLVVAAHAMPTRFVNGGAVGVTMFFALSGFLITSLLLRERRVTGRISISRFYGRRARRLLPALIAYLAFWLALSTAGVGLFQVRPGEVIVALLYFMNWVMAGNLPISDPMGITWSLSIEEQFYLVWPLTFILARRWPRLPLVAAVIGIVAAIAARALSWDGTNAMWAIYYRTDTRMDSLFVGCLLAIVVHRVGIAWVRTWMGFLGGVVVIALLAVETDVVKFGAVPLLAAVATCCYIASVLAGRSRWLGLSPLRWLGRRSYALYLWHYPLCVLAWDGTDILPMWVSLVLAFAAAELSWWVVETPFRRRRTGSFEPPSGAGEGQVSSKRPLVIDQSAPSRA